jgi:adenylate cyclase
MTAARVACDQCGTDLRDEARFCDACGAPIMSAHTPAEYKQVTVLFADVVRSMDIASALEAPNGCARSSPNCSTDPPRWCKRYGGTVDTFTGDGIMASRRC